VVTHGLFERDADLRQLETLMGAAIAGHGGVALVHGAAGIGKTRLLQVVSEGAADSGVRVLSARGSDLEQQFAYGVVRQLVGDAVLPSGRRPTDSELLQGDARFASPLFEPGESSPTLAPADRSAAVLHGLYSLICEIAEPLPLLVAVDDAHWADAPSLLFLDYLGRRISTIPVAIVLTYREHESGTEAAVVRRLAADARVLELHRLSEEASAELVRSFLGSETSAEICRACFAATDGNPFLLHELAVALTADLISQSRADVASRVARLVPDAVARNVLVRLSRLGPASIRLARAIAVLGGGADLRHAAALAELDALEAARCVDALVTGDIVAPGLPLDFLHPLLRETVYADVGLGERMLAHARAARILADSGVAAERVAQQLLASEPSGSEWATSILQIAAGDAVARGAPSSAVRYLERALEERSAEGDRGSLLFELGVAESRAGCDGAVDHLLEASRLTGDVTARARIAPELAALYNLLGRFNEAATVLEEAIDDLDDSQPELRFSIEAEAAVLGVTVLAGRRRLASRLARLRERGRALTESPGAAPLLAILAEELTEAHGTAAEAVTYAEHAFADPSLLSREGPVLAIGVSAFILGDRPSRAEAILDAAIADAQKRGSLYGTRLAIAFRAFARNRRGRLAEAAADARYSLELASGQQADPVQPFKIAQLAEALIEQGAFAEAEALLAPTELVAYDEDSKLFQPLANVHARLLLLQGRFGEALTRLNSQLRWMEAWGCKTPGWTSARTLAALAHKAIGEDEEALTLASDDLDAASKFGAPRPLGIAIRTLALVDERGRIDRLRESASVLKESESTLELSRTLVELGSALRRRGDRRQARDPLRLGLELAHDSGGALIAERARAELLASGARPRRPWVAGPDALTASERRIALLASDGFSNQQIAQQLFLSHKTVEMHLSHTYQKLNIHSRRQLATALQVRQQKTF
jgi:DNA-binding CsgD family transcriptional regulator